MMRNHLSVIFLPTNKCNVNCEYCFEDKTADRMSLDQLSTVIGKTPGFHGRKQYLFSHTPLAGRRDYDDARRVVRAGP